MAGFLYQTGANGLLSGTISFTADTIKARLFLTSATGDPDSDVMTGLGVTGNDITLTTKTGPVIDDVNDRNVYDCDNIIFLAQPAGSECDSIIIFKFVTNDADSIPIALVPIAAVTPNGGDITATVPSTGIFYLQHGV